MKSWLGLAAVAVSCCLGSSLLLAGALKDSEAPRLPKVLPGYPQKIAVAEVWKLIDSQRFGFPGCTQRVRFEGKSLNGSRVYYQPLSTPWLKSKQRVTVTYAYATDASVITEVKLGDQNYYRSDRAQAFFTWDDRLAWEK